MYVTPVYPQQSYGSTHHHTKLKKSLQRQDGCYGYIKIKVEETSTTATNTAPSSGSVNENNMMSLLKYKRRKLHI